MVSIRIALAFFWFGCAVCIAQAADGPTCDSDREGDLRAKFAEIEEGFAKVWERRGPDWITALDLAPETRNPFDLRKREITITNLQGYAWLRDVSCNIRDGKLPGTRIITYTASVFRFKEGRSKWSRPMKNGVIALYLLTQKDSHWVIEDKSPEESIFLPEGIKRKPRPDELPPQKIWPDKRCPIPKIWQGEDCIMPAQKPNSPAMEKSHAG